MDRRVFNYRSGMMYFLVAFLSVWAGGWLYGVASSWSNPTVHVNGRLATPQEAHTFMFVALAIGVLVALLDLFALLYTINCRVEVAHGYISWYDWLGNLKVRGSLASARLTQGESQSVKGYVETEGGDITLRSGINDFGILANLITGRGTPEGAPPHPYSGYVPPSATYNYRWTYLHFFSFIWLGAIAFMGVMALDPNTQGRGIALFLIPFGAIGVWMQLTGWVERITIGPAGIEWVDCLGRVRVHARLDQIVNVDVASGSRGSSCQIETTAGTIRASSNIRDWQTLISETERVARSVDSGEQDLSELRTVSRGTPQGRW